MAKPEDWELQLVPLIQTVDLLDVFEIEGSTLAGVSQREDAEGSVAQNKEGVRDDATKSGPEAPIIDMAVRKATLEKVQIRSYPMEARGAVRCLREAIFLRKNGLTAETAPPQFWRGLSHFIAPLGIWTSDKTSHLHVRLSFLTHMSGEIKLLKPKIHL